MRYIVLLALLTLYFDSSAQDCKLVRRTSKKLAVVASKGGSVLSEDLLLLTLQKDFDPNNLDDTLNYSGMIIVGSRYQLNDSVTNSIGKFEFALENGDTLIWGGAKVSNLGHVLMSAYPNAIFFNVRATEKQLAPLTKYRVTQFSTFNILKTTFGAKEQRKLLTIAQCLIKEKNE